MITRRRPALLTHRRPAAPYPSRSPTQQESAAQDPRPTLSRCIGVPTDEFAGHFWATAPLLTPAEPGRAGFADLFSAAAVDELISARGLRTPFLRMAKNGSVLATSMFTRSGGVGAGIADQVADDKVLAQLAGGATLVLQALHRTWPPLITLRHRGWPSNLATRCRSTRTSPRRRTRDSPPTTTPTTSSSCRSRAASDGPSTGRSSTTRCRARPGNNARRRWRPGRPRTPLIDTLLRPGDALYLPRGFLHSAVAQGEVSIHLTVGVHPVTAYDLAREMIAAAATDRELRRSLPLGVDVTDAAVMRDHVRAAAKRLAARSARPVPRSLSPSPERLGGNRSAKPGRRRSAHWPSWPRSANSPPALR